MNVITYIWQWLLQLQYTLETYPAFGFGLVAVLGLIAGSCVGCISYRIPKMLYHEWYTQARNLLKSSQDHSTQSDVSKKLGLWSPPSHCIGCHKRLGLRELIPVISYCILRGRCRHCRATISIRYPAIELISMLLVLLMYWLFGASIYTLLLSGFACMAITLIWIDAEHMLLPDYIVMPLLWAGLVLNFFDFFVTSANSFWSCIVLYLLFTTIASISSKTLGREALGQGDVKLIAALGAWMGWQPIAPLLAMATSSALVYLSLRWWLVGISVRYPMPFGPFLLLSGLVCLILQTLWLSETNGGWQFFYQ